MNWFIFLVVLSSSLFNSPKAKEDYIPIGETNAFFGKIEGFELFQEKFFECNGRESKTIKREVTDKYFILSSYLNNLHYAFGSYNPYHETSLPFEPKFFAYNGDHNFEKRPNTRKINTSRVSDKDISNIRVRAIRLYPTDRKNGRYEPIYCYKFFMIPVADLTDKEREEYVYPMWFFTAHSTVEYNNKRIKNIKERHEKLTSGELEYIKSLEKDNKVWQRTAPQFRPFAKEALRKYIERKTDDLVREIIHQEGKKSIQEDQLKNTSKRRWLGLRKNQTYYFIKDKIADIQSEIDKIEQEIADLKGQQLPSFNK